MHLALCLAEPASCLTVLLLLPCHYFTFVTVPAQWREAHTRGPGGSRRKPWLSLSWPTASREVLSLCCGATSLECPSGLGPSSLCDLGQVTAPLWVVCPSTMPLRALLGLLVSYSSTLPTRKATWEPALSTPHVLCSSGCSCFTSASGRMAPSEPLPQ